jgi:hypothetical protein
MARKRKAKKSSAVSKSRPRVYTTLNANRPRLRPVLEMATDRRLFNPFSSNQLVNVRGERVGVSTTFQKAPLGKRGGAFSMFKVPANVGVCVRRKRRKEVLHAKGVAGSRVRRGKSNRFTKVRC